MMSARYGPRIVELFQSAVSRELDTMYLGDSLKNGAPGSSSAVRADHAGANASYVRRPSRIAWHDPVIAAIAPPIAGSKPNSNVQDGSSKTPSRAMNSCTLIAPTVINSIVSGPAWRTRHPYDQDLAANSSRPVPQAGRQRAQAGQQQHGGGQQNRAAREGKRGEDDSLLQLEEAGQAHGRDVDGGDDPQRPAVPAPGEDGQADAHGQQRERHQPPGH